MKLIDNRGFADAGVSGDQNQLRPSAGDNTIERRKQSFNLPLPAVQLLWYQQPVRQIVRAQRE